MSTVCFTLFQLFAVIGASQTLEPKITLRIRWIKLKKPPQADNDKLLQKNRLVWVVFLSVPVPHSALPLHCLLHPLIPVWSRNYMVAKILLRILCSSICVSHPDHFFFLLFMNHIILPLWIRLFMSWFIRTLSTWVSIGPNIFSVFTLG